MRFIDVLPREDVPDLADPVHLHAGVTHEREVVRPSRLEREVVPVRRPLVISRRADEGTCDHPADRVLSGEDLPRNPARAVELFERNRLLVCRNLEDGVGRRVDDPLAGPLMLLPELLDDLGTGGWPVPEYP